MRKSVIISEKEYELVTNAYTPIRVNLGKISSKIYLE